MQVLYPLYIILSYTIGIASLSWLLLLYIQKKNSNNLRLFAFILSMTISFMAFSLREFILIQNAVWSALPLVSLLGAALTIIFFPLYAKGLSGVKQKSLPLALFTISGVVLFFLVLWGLLFSSLIVQQLSTIFTLSVLGVSVIYSLFTLNKAVKQVQESKSPKRHILKFLFPALTLALFILDFLGGLNFLNPGLKRHFTVFPAFYAFLNLVLIRSNLKFPSNFPEEPYVEPILPEQYKISRRESEVLLLLAKGKTYREIADALFVSLATVKSHVAHLFEKTGAHNKVELLNLTGK
jgi:DNA-binding CsgD family transcriptional regulator